MLFYLDFCLDGLRNKNFSTCCQLANACGALVVSRHSCAPAMPTQEELKYFLEKQIKQPAKDVTLNRIHRVSVNKQKWNEIFVFAFDHRSQLLELAQQAKQPESKISQLK